MEESFIGGFYNHQGPPPSPLPPPLPPKDGLHIRPVHPTLYPPPNGGLPSSSHNAGSAERPAAHAGMPSTTQPAFPVHSQPSFPTQQLTHLTAVERSQLLRVARMEPHLQVCPQLSFSPSPLARRALNTTTVVYVWTAIEVTSPSLEIHEILTHYRRYDTTDSQGIWRGAALVVTTDSGSVYHPHPKLTYEWDPDKLTPSTLRAQANGKHAPNPVQRSTSNHQSENNHRGQGLSLELGPHPADPHAIVLPGSPISTSASTSTVADPPGPNASREDSYGQEIWVYASPNG